MVDCSVGKACLATEPTVVVQPTGTSQLLGPESSLTKLEADANLI